MSQFHSFGTNYSPQGSSYYHQDIPQRKAPPLFGPSSKSLTKSSESIQLHLSQIEATSPAKDFNNYSTPPQFIPKKLQLSQTQNAYTSPSHFNERYQAYSPNTRQNTLAESESEQNTGKQQGSEQYQKQIRKINEYQQTIMKLTDSPFQSIALNQTNASLINPRANTIQNGNQFRSSKRVNSDFVHNQQPVGQGYLNNQIEQNINQIINTHYQPLQVKSESERSFKNNTSNENYQRKWDPLFQSEPTYSKPYDLKTESSYGGNMHKPISSPSGTKQLFPPQFAISEATERIIEKWNNPKTTLFPNHSHTQDRYHQKQNSSHINSNVQSSHPHEYFHTLSSYQSNQAAKSQNSQPNFIQSPTEHLDTLNYHKNSNIPTQNYSSNHNLNNDGQQQQQRQQQYQQYQQQQQQLLEQQEQQQYQLLQQQQQNQFDSHNPYEVKGLTNGMVTKYEHHNEFDNKSNNSSQNPRQKGTNDQLIDQNRFIDQQQQEFNLNEVENQKYETDNDSDLIKEKLQQFEDSNNLNALNNIYESEDIFQRQKQQVKQRKFPNDQFQSDVFKSLNQNNDMSDFDHSDDLDMFIKKSVETDKDKKGKKQETKITPATTPQEKVDKGNQFLFLLFYQQYTVIYYFIFQEFTGQQKDKADSSCYYWIAGLIPFIHSSYKMNNIILSNNFCNRG